MAKILIPTPLRPYTDKQDAVDATGATIRSLPLMPHKVLAAIEEMKAGGTR